MSLDEFVASCFVVATCILGLLLFWAHQDNRDLKARILVLETANSSCQRTLGQMKVYQTPDRKPQEPWEVRE